MTRRNITNEEAKFFDTVGALVNEAPRSMLTSAPMLFSNRVSVQTLVSRYELYKMILNVPGDIVECGVYQGNSFLWMAHLSVILEPYAINRRFVGFDTFEGFASIDETKDPTDISAKNFSDTSYEVISESLRALDLVRPVNRIKRFELVKGDIVETVPQYLKDNPGFTCSLLILDTDLYKPTLVALQNFIPHMPKGAIVVFDEFNYENFRGETIALKEFGELGKFRMKRFGYDSCMAYFEIE